MNEIDAKVGAVGSVEASDRASAAFSALKATRRLPATRGTPRDDTAIDAHAETLGAERYADLERIAAGGMGVIYKAHDKRLRRDLAVKVLPARDAAEDLWAADRFIDEAQITAQLDHPGVVPVYELGAREDGGLFFAMKLVRGRTLSEVFRLARGEKDGWSLTKVVQLFLRICETMAFAHSKGVIHRDLKPANVMVGRFGEVYVMDWGVAKVADAPIRTGDRRTGRRVRTHRHTEGSESSPSLTMFGDVLGTPAYMSPEQARGHHDDLDARCDVYALGALLYEVLAGHAPYDGQADTARGLHAEVLRGPPRALSERAPRAPEELVAIVGKAMERQPADRYDDADALRTDLQAWLEGRVVSAHGGGPLIELRKWVARNRTLAGVLLMTTLLAIGGAVAFGVMQRHAATSIAKERDLEQVARTRAVGERLSAQAVTMVDQDPGLALRLAIEGSKAAPGSVAARAALYRVTPEFTQRGIYEGHDGYVLRFDINAAETRIVSRARETMMILWDLKSTRIIARMMGHSEDPLGVRFVDGGKTIISWDATGTVILWDGETGALRHRVSFEAEQPLLFGATTGRSHVAIASKREGGGSDVALLDTRTGTVDSTLSFESLCIAVGLVPGTKRHAVLTDDGTLHVVSTDADTPSTRTISLGDPTDQPNRRPNPNPDMHWDAENERMLVGTAWSTITAVDLDAGTTTWEFRDEGLTLAVFVREPLAAPGQLMAIVDEVGTENVIVTIDRKTGALRNRKALWSHFYAALPTENWVAMRSDSRIRLTDVKNRRVERDLIGHTYTTSDARGLRDGQRVITSGFDMKLRLWRTSDEKNRRSLKHDEVSYYADAKQGGQYVFYADHQKNGADRAPLVLRDPVTNEEKYRFETGDRDARWMGVFDEGRRAVALAPGDRMAYFYDRGVFTHAQPLPGKAAGAERFSLDGSIMVFSAADSEYLFCGTNVPGEVQVLKPTHERPHSVYLSPDGSKFLTINGGRPRTGRIWDRTTLSPLHELLGHNGYVLGGAFHPNGKIVATAAVDRSVRLWDVESGKLLRRCEGLEMLAAKVYFGPGGKYVSAATPGRTCIFETETGLLYASINYSQEWSGRGSPFSPDGSHVLTGRPDRGLQYWSLDPLAHAEQLGAPELVDSQLKAYGLPNDGGSERRSQDQLMNTKSAYRLSLMARSALRASKIQRARALVDRSLSIRTDLPHVYLVLAACQVRTGEFEAGIKNLAHAIELGIRPDRKSLELSTDFAAVRTHPGFLRILGGLK